LKAQVLNQDISEKVLYDEPGDLSSYHTMHRRDEFLNILFLLLAILVIVGLTQKGQLKPV